jgi:predicted patatin/cPLA2 family phospholipase
LPAELDHVPALAAPPTERPRRSLILAGGGMRVAYQAGVLRALEQEGLTFFHLDGTSGGTINLAMLLSGHSPREICERWRTLDVRQFVSLLPIRKYVRSLDWPAFGGAGGLVDRVYPHLGIDVDRIRAATGIEGTFNVCNYTDKTNRAVPHREIDLDLLVAGVSLPMMMPPVRRDGALYLDSVWIKDANPTEAVRRGCDEMWLVWCIGNSGLYRPGAFNQYVHMIELSANGGLFEELAHLRREQQAPLPALHVVKPEYPLPLDPDFYLGRIDATALIAAGYRDAKRYLAGRSAEGVPYDADTTRMRDPRPGLAFADRLSGTATIDGKPAPFAVEVRVDVRDIERFASNENETGELVGIVDSKALGHGIPAKSGSFRMGGGWLEYELVLEHRSQDVCLTLRIPTQPWRRAEAALHEGSERTGTSLGSGTFPLGLRREVRLLRSLQATGTDSFREAAKIVAISARSLLRGR